MGAGVGGGDESDAECVNGGRVMCVCCSQRLGESTLKGTDEWVGTSSLLFIMVGGLTGIHHNHSSTL